MNKSQRYIINTAVAVVVAMALFPPWYMKAGGGRVINLGYAPIFLPPTYEKSVLSGTINMKTLFVQWVAVVVVAAWAYKMKGER